MKKVITILAVFIFVFLSKLDKVHTYGTGAPAANTASPGDGGATCNSAYCHSGPAAQSGENIAISVFQPLNQESYRISIEVSNSGGMQYEKVGFQACIEDVFGNKIGDISLVDPLRTKFANGNSDYITHTLSGTAPSDNFSHSWEFDWTAPEDFDGVEATVYVASILSNNNNQNNGDIHITNNFTLYLGCMDESATNYNPLSNIDDGSCISQDGYTIDSLNIIISTLSSQILDLQQELLVPNIYVDMDIGWNIVGFTCPQQRTVEAALGNIVDELVIFKDNNGNVYLPEFGFNGIGDLIPGHGYQLKVTDYISDFNICE